MKNFRKLLGLILAFWFLTAYKTNAENLKAGLDTNEMATAKYFSLQLSDTSTKSQEMIIKFDKDAQIGEDIDGPNRIYFFGHKALEFCCISDGGTRLAIRVLQLPEVKPEIIKLYVYAKNCGDFKLNVAAIANLPKHLKVMLLDKYANISVELMHNKCYSFNIDKNAPLSYGDRRFILVIYQNQNYSYRSSAFGINENNKGVSTRSISGWAQGITN